jgi:hypothetical protein
MPTMQALPFRLLGVLILCVCGFAGCEPDDPAPVRQATVAPAAPPVAPVKPPPPERPPLVLTSIDQALDELIAALDEHRPKDYKAAAAYLESRGAEAVGPIESRLSSEGLSAPAEIALVRQLGPAGEAALPALEKLTDPSQKEIVRINAIGQIGRVRPVTPRATDFLRAILRDGELRDRAEALEALDRQEARSAELAEDLRQIMDSDAPSSLRIQAKKSLDRVVPRRTLEDRD